MTGLCYSLYEMYRVSYNSRSCKYIYNVYSNITFITLNHFSIVSIYDFFRFSFQHQVKQTAPHSIFFLLVISRSFIHCSLCSQARSKGRGRSWNKAIKRWWSAPLFQDTAWMRIHSAGVNHFFSVDHIGFFFMSSRLLFNNFWRGSQLGPGSSRTLWFLSCACHTSPPVWWLDKTEAAKPGCIRWLWLARGCGAEQAQLSLLWGRKQRLLIRQNNETMLARHTPHSTHCLKKAKFAKLPH